MTGFGSPCGACKFLRRKCVKGCVFAPYFCHEQGATHFAAIHKVFGASNVSKLLMHLPVPDRSEAAVTISYEAQARLQDPIYGCVSHIFALQQQVVSLQAQLAALKAQAAHSIATGAGSRVSASSSAASASQPSYQPDMLRGLTLNEDMKVQLQQYPLSQGDMLCFGGVRAGSTSAQGFAAEGSSGGATQENGSGCLVTSCGVEMDDGRFGDMDDLQSIAFGYLQHS